MSRFTSSSSMSAACGRWFKPTKSPSSIVSPPSTVLDRAIDTLPTMTASQVAAFKYASNFKWQRVVTIRRDGQYRVGGQTREAKYRPVLDVPHVAPLNLDYSIRSMPAQRRVTISRTSVQRPASCVSSPPRVSSRRVGSRFAVLPSIVAVPSVVVASPPVVSSLSDLTPISAPEGHSRHALYLAGLGESPAPSVVVSSLHLVAGGSLSPSSNLTMSDSDWTPIGWPIECSVRNGAMPVKIPGFSDETMTESDWTGARKTRHARTVMASPTVVSSSFSAVAPSVIAGLVSALPASPSVAASSPSIVSSGFSAVVPSVIAGLVSALPASPSVRDASLSRLSTSTMSERDWTPIGVSIEYSVRDGAGPVKFRGYSDETMTESDWTPIGRPRVTRPTRVAPPSTVTSEFSAVNASAVMRMVNEPEVGRSCPQESSFVEDSSLCAPSFILSRSNFKSIVPVAAIPVDAYKVGPIPGAWPEYTDDTPSNSWSLLSGLKKVASWFGQFF